MSFRYIDLKGLRPTDTQGLYYFWFKSSDADRSTHAVLRMYDQVLVHHETKEQAFIIAADERTIGYEYQGKRHFDVLVHFATFFQLRVEDKDG